MSGIAGIARFDDEPIKRQRLAAMLERLAHRGPDGTGLVHLPRCSLGAAQLSIIDLFSGAQPMHFEGDSAEEDGLNLVFNGEIYNHRELRRKLERRGHRFRSSHSDTEVLLRGYREWGDQLPKHLQGMWAFAVWDAQRRELFLCRDRVGAKPLYLARRPGEVRFASMISSLLAGRASGETASINPDALKCFLQLGHTLGHSMIAGLEELPPAHSLTFNAKGGEELDRYWRPPPISKTSTSLGAVDALREVIGESVSQRLLADVPLASVINGGLDAAVVTAVAQRHYQKKMDGKPLQTVSLTIEDVDRPDQDPGSALAKHLGTRHNVLAARPGDIVEDLRGFVERTGEPLGDVTLLRTLWLCRAARERFQVLLTGNGGAELFGGWPRYRMMGSLARHRWWIAKLPNQRRPRQANRSGRMKRLLQAATSGEHPATQYLHLIQLLSPDQTATLAAPLIEQSRQAPWQALPEWTEESDHAHAAMRWDLINALPYRELRRVDRASMSVALEVRFPFLGTPVLDLAGHLPSPVLMPGHRPMGLLIQVAQGLLPSWAIRRYRPARTLPLAQWLRGPLRDSIYDHLGGEPLSRLGLSPSVARAYIEDHLSGASDHHAVLFALLQLAMWSDWLAEQADLAPFDKA
ncbi:MAG: asparagine synthase (glutamine-hydrolyzing) [Planctomycetota bacterium]